MNPTVNLAVPLRLKAKAGRAVNEPFPDDGACPVSDAKIGENRLNESAPSCASRNRVESDAEHEGAEHPAEHEGASQRLAHFREH